MWRQLLTEYGMILVLLLLCVLFSLLTWAEQQPVGSIAARQVAKQLQQLDGAKAGTVLIVIRPHAEDEAFANELARMLAETGSGTIEKVAGDPSDIRAKFEQLAEQTRTLTAVIATRSTASWGVVEKLHALFPKFSDVPVIVPESYRWPNFLKRENLLNIANQISVIAMVAIGMTMVIIAGGIDLSVGSLIALAAVVAARLIRDMAGAEQATSMAMFACCAVAIAVTGLVGASTGVVATVFRVPAFIVTLAVMLIASGLAYILAEGQSISQIPDRFVWLGRGSDLIGVPNSVLLMIVLYLVAHVTMSQTTLGRYLYAVGGNAEASRLSGVPVKRTIVISFAISGLLAGLGGVVLASQLKSGSPTYGQMYELYVIAAVVVGGTSLSGGEGKIFGTLIGAFIIAVIQNGMNLMGIESYTQKVVLGSVILAAVLIDRLRNRVD